MNYDGHPDLLPSLARSGSVEIIITPPEPRDVQSGGGEVGPSDGGVSELPKVLALQGWRWSGEMGSMRLTFAVPRWAYLCVEFVYHLRATYL